MSTTRREFVATAAAWLALQRPASAQKPPSSDRRFGVQLYTVRDQLREKREATLAAIRAMGYQCVETFVAEYSMSAKELRKLLTGADLAIPSAHFGYADFDSRLEYAKELGVEYVVCSSVPRPMAVSADGFKQAAEQYNKWGEQCRKLGMHFGFHNHNFEFQSFGGMTGIETLLVHTDPDLVKWQMDCYWVTNAGFDPAALIRRYSNRIQTLHVKDRKAGAPVSLTTNDPKYFTEVGAGTLDWKAISAAAKAADVPYFFVEQDKTDKDPLESLRISFAGLQRLFA